MGIRTFPSKTDHWLLWVVGLTLVTGPIATAVLALLLPEPSLWAVFALTGVTTGFVVWIFRTTRYRIEESRLMIQSGPFRWNVALAEIESVTPTRNPLSSPALSLDRLEIRRSRGGSILVSPLDRGAFLDALARAATGLERTGDQLVRRKA